MVVSYLSRKKYSHGEADCAAIAIAMIYHKSFNKTQWNCGGWPLNMDLESRNSDITCIYDVYLMLKNTGKPLYAYYFYQYTDKDGEEKTIAHLVVVTGANCENNTVYTNNPWGVRGKQSFEDFQNGFADGGKSTKSYQLGYVIPVN